MVPFACSQCGRQWMATEPAATCPHCGNPSVHVAIEVPGYEILGVLGRGGMAVVYKARQLSPRRLVALKMMLSGGHAGPNDVERFLRDADALALLSHPNIVQIHAAGEHQGYPYLTLEFVEGGNLTQRLREGPLPFRTAAELVRQVARGMSFAHEIGIIHRDLKPSNILLTGDSTAKIADFGLAKQLDGISAANTQSGAILGTPTYMAPEQAEGRSKDIGTPADIYALGAILYECLTGRPPFQADTPIDTLLKVAVEEPTPPRRLRRDCPRDLEIICLKCLQKQPQARYGSAGELADDLTRWLDGEPIRARPPSKMRRLLRTVRRRKEFLYLAAGVLLTLGVVAYFVVRSERERATAGQSQANLNAMDQKPPANNEPPRNTEDAAGRIRLSLRRQSTANNLKQLALAVSNMEAVYNALPPSAITDKRTGQPLLSWRVAILPFIEQSGLYQRFKFDEPWDGPNNSKLLPLMPKIFAIEGVQPPQPYSTFFQVFVGPGTAFEPRRVPHPQFGFSGTTIREFLDGARNTILIAEAAEAVPWTKPADLPYHPDRPLPKLGGAFPDGFFVATADIDVRFVPKTISEQSLRAAITRNGHDILGDDWLASANPPRNKSGREAVKREEAANLLRQTNLNPNAGQLAGRVTFKGTPVTDATLTFHSQLGDGKQYAVHVQKDGKYRTGALKPGKYIITLSGKGGIDKRYPPKLAAVETSPVTCQVMLGINTVHLELSD